MGRSGVDFSELLRLASDAQDFFRRVVLDLGRLVGADACTLFVVDPRHQKLILRATKGLNPESEGQIAVDLDEGLVGLSLREQRVVRETDPQFSPWFKPVPRLYEDDFRSLTALPIMAGTTPLGVLVVHLRRSEPLGGDQLKILQDNLSVLGTALHDAQVLSGIKTVDPGVSVKVTKGKVFPASFAGKASSNGLARGRSLAWGRVSSSTPLRKRSDTAYRKGLGDFTQARIRSLEQTERLQKETEDSLSDVASMIFSTHVLMLKDESFTGAMESLIHKDHSAPDAVVEIVNQYLSVLAASPSPLIQEKVQDVKDLGLRLLRNLEVQPGVDGDLAGQILLAEELLPSDLVKAAAQHAEGIVLLNTGATAHVSILAKSLGIPVLFCDDRRVLEISDGTNLVLDASGGTVYVDPRASILEALEKDAVLTSIGAPAPVCHDQTFTDDGVQIHLLANINLLSDVKVARKNHAEGIGLYRSEFPFLIRNDFPTEDEQYAVYRRLILQMAGQEVVLRTLDVGGDKVLSYLPESHESNPFLGLRALRFSLRNQQLFQTQLRAMLRAGQGHELRILFPLVSSVDDFRAAKAEVYECLRHLDASGIPHNPVPFLGAMIELPSACEVAGELAAECDFLSLGTNDLVQYLLGVDRTNEAVSDLYTAYHPAVYRTLQRVLRAAQNHQTSISVCGEIASDSHMIPFLVGAGLRKFSLSPGAIPRVQNLIEGLNSRHCQVHAEKLGRFGTIAEIREYLGIEP